MQRAVGLGSDNLTAVAGVAKQGAAGCRRVVKRWKPFQRHNTGCGKTADNPVEGKSPRVDRGQIEFGRCPSFSRFDAEHGVAKHAAAGVVERRGAGDGERHLDAAGLVEQR